MRKRRTIDKRRPDSIKDQLKGTEKRLPQERIKEERLNSRGKVRVQTRDAERFVVC